MNNDRLIDSAAQMLALLEEVLDAADREGVIIGSHSQTTEWLYEAGELVDYIQDGEEEE